MKLFYFLAILIAIPFFAFSQNHQNEVQQCGQYTVTEAYFNEHPEKRELAQQQYREALEMVHAAPVSTTRDADFIIPVVFHIVHANGQENISDEQIYSCLEVLNEDITAQNSGADNVMSEFQDIVGSVSVEFRLAKIDPDGNCTSGINRVYNMATNNDAGDNIKSGDAATWGREKYLNIWVVGNSSVGSGYAYFPWGGAPADADGIVLEHSYVGNIGTSNSTRSHNITHEVGHYLGLFHVWGNTNNAGLPGNCESDDNIEDTPFTIGHTSCNTGDETCGSLDNVENYMDYSFCYKMFTQEQAAVMNFVLENGNSERDNLYSPENLEATGVLADEELCLADFAPSLSPVICEGESLIFEDQSFYNPSEWSWTFEGGESNETSEPTATVLYTEPGIYDVTLTVSDGTNSVSVTREDFVRVLESGSEDQPFVEDFESIDELGDANSGWIVTNLDESDVKWQITNDASYSGVNSVYVNGWSNSNFTESIEYLSSQTIDLSELSENAVLSFKYAHARRSIFSEDKLQVFVSQNCGEIWSIRETIDMDELPTVENTVPGQFFPSDEDDWQEVVVDNISPFFTNEFFRFQFVFTSSGGNNLFIDDINVYDPLVVGTEENAEPFDLKLFPNPADDFARLNFMSQDDQIISLQLVDVIGNEIYLADEIIISQDHVYINTQQLKAGVYLLRIKGNKVHQTLRLVVQH